MYHEFPRRSMPGTYGCFTPDVCSSATHKSNMPHGFDNLAVIPGLPNYWKNEAIRSVKSAPKMLLNMLQEGGRGKKHE
ncbi:hypothetical protein AKJ16_DCAP17459 [Drosera capensis]